MPEHVLVLFNNLLECSDAVWAQNQYSSERIYALRSVIEVASGPERPVLHLKVSDRTKLCPEWYQSKLCDACRSAILWDKVSEFQSRLDSIERNLADIENRL